MAASTSCAYRDLGVSVTHTPMGRTGQASIHAVLDDFTTKLKRRQFPDSSVSLARHTTETLIHAVAAQQAPTVDGIIEGVRAVSQKLVDARPLGKWQLNQLDVINPTPYSIH